MKPSMRPRLHSAYSLFRPATLLLTCLLGLALQAWPQKPQVNPLSPKTPVEKKAEPAPSTAHQMTAPDVEAFLDGLMPLQLEQNDVAGATVAVVKDGEVLLVKGYGYADVEKRKPVSGEDTLFRPGSVSKLFTWTAVMQLVEQGKIDLDKDVNEYLDFKIPATYPQPITMRNIMTHTAGFGETAKDLFVADTDDVKPLKDYLVAHMPRRIFAPGTVPAYSNYATTMAGYIVQRVSGQPLDEYIRQHIFDPLKMEKTTYAQPLPANLKPLMSNGYKVASSPAGMFEVVQAWPAGSISTSAADMAHFIIAHLQKGEYEGARILRPETAELMHSRQFAPHPAMNGMALGFYEETRNGHRIIGHAGDTTYFHSDLHLIPDANVGFFVSYNSPGKSEISERTALWQKFLDRYFPYEPPSALPVATAAADLREVQGRYMASRRGEGTLISALNAFGQVTVTGNADGTISLDEVKGFNGESKKLREIAPLVFREVNGQDKVAFQRDASGRLYLAIDFPFFIFQRVGLIESKPFNTVVLGGSIGIMVLALLFWPIAALVRRHYGRKLDLSLRERRLRLFARIVCLLNLLFFGGLFLLASISDDPGALTYHLDLKIHLLQVIGLLGAIGAVLVVYNALVTARAWRSRRVSVAAAGSSTSESSLRRSEISSRGWGAAVSEALIALACIGFSWFAIYWSLLNFHLNY